MKSCRLSLEHKIFRDISFLSLDRPLQNLNYVISFAKCVGRVFNFPYAIDLPFRLNACGDWQMWETVVGQDTKLTVQKLDRGTSYQFRVRALNKAGKSQASHPSRGKEARAQNCEFCNL